MILLVYGLLLVFAWSLVAIGGEPKAPGGEHGAV